MHQTQLHPKKWTHRHGAYIYIYLPAYPGVLSKLRRTIESKDSSICLLGQLSWYGCHRHPQQNICCIDLKSIAVEAAMMWCEHSLPYHFPNSSLEYNSIVEANLVLVWTNVMFPYPSCMFGDLMQGHLSTKFFRVTCSSQLAGVCGKVPHTLMIITLRRMSSAQVKVKACRLPNTYLAGTPLLPVEKLNGPSPQDIFNNLNVLNYIRKSCRSNHKDIRYL